jgi:hypothetical protein
VRVAFDIIPIPIIEANVCQKATLIVDNKRLSCAKRGDFLPDKL